jgi:hypothetical protein
MTDLLERLVRWLGYHAPGVYHSLQPGVTPQGLQAWEQAYALRELYSWRDGQAPRARPFFADAYARYTFMALREVGEVRAGLNEVLGELEEEGSPGRDHLCVDSQGGVPGRSSRWRRTCGTNATTRWSC